MRTSHKVRDVPDNSRRVLHTILEFDSLNGGEWSYNDALSSIHKMLEALDGAAVESEEPD